MIQFYAPDITTTGILPADESRHCCKVLRHRSDDVICVIDGLGERYQCRIVDPDPRATQVEIISSEAIGRHWHENITLAVAPTKNMDRLEWMTEKAVEIGVDSIVPLLCTHSERKVVKTERLVNIAVSAMKQSLKTTLPTVAPLTPFKSFMAECSRQRIQNPGLQLFMGYCDATYPRKELIREYSPGSDVIILIGPEGDFSPEEVKEAVRVGFVPVTFGPSRLRTETAAITALNAIHFLNEQHDEH
ncbi:MAG: 16S rRNA (uracil(1498)-N(3))-methyltransferase [Muribaculaceae bacterium]|nr:16S rRNA (uracil(1498)-N(3))-methyltransferase [Muribaculaceae bacterium]